MSEIRGTGNIDVNNPETREMIEYLSKKGKEAKTQNLSKTELESSIYENISGR